MQQQHIIFVSGEILSNVSLCNVGVLTQSYGEKTVWSPKDTPHSSALSVGGPEILDSLY